MPLCEQLPRQDLFRLNLLILPALLMAAQISSASNCATVPSGLVAWWAGENNANDSLGLNNGTAMLGATYAAGEVGQAFSFPGSESRVLIPDNNTSFKLTNALSIEAWVNVNADGGYVFFRGDDRPGLDPYALTVGSGTIQFGLQSASDSVGIAAPIAYHEWHHVAATWDRATGGMNLYIDGALLAQTNTSVVPLGDLDLSSNPYVSIGNVGGTGNDFAYNGLADEIAVYSRALSQAEIQSIFNAGAFGKCGVPPAIVTQPTNQAVVVGGTASFSVTASGSAVLTYQWQFDGTNIANATGSVLTLTSVQTNQAGNYSVLVTNTAGSILSSNALLTVLPPPPCINPASNIISWWCGEGNALDQVGGNNGTISNNVTFGNGVVSNAFVFDGIGSVVRLGNPPALQLQDFTIELWAKRTSSSVVSLDGNGNGMLFSFDNNGYGFYLDPNGHPTLSKIGVNNVSCGAAVTDRTWHHLAVTKTNSIVVFYIDGAPFSTAPYNPGFTFTGSFWLGGIGNTLSFYGSIDEAAVYNRALTAGEISAIYSVGSSGKCRVTVPPFYISQTPSQTNYVGASISLTNVAGGSVPLSYQWRLNTTPIAGATGSVLSLSNLQLTNAGTYSVLVSNAAGAVVGSNTVVTVLVLPPCSSPASNLISWWRGESNALDQVGGNNGTLSNNVTFAPGVAGSAFVFDGSGAVVRVGNPLSLQIQDFTIELWARRSSSSVVSLDGNGNGMLFSFDNNGYGLYLDTGGHPALSKIGVNNVTCGTAVTDTAWHHLAVTKTNSTVVFYIDGTAFPASAYNPGFTFNGSFWIGGVGNTLTFYGSIDEPSVYNRALTASEIASIYNGGLSGKCLATVAPFLISQAASQTNTVGASVAFTNVVGGSVPFVYQWRLNGTNVPGATSNVLVLNSAQFSQAGSYSLVASNAAGFVVSSNALLTLNFPPASARVISTNVNSGSSVVVPIVLVANGNENALGFSLAYDISKLAFASAVSGPGAPGVTLTINLSQTNAGHVGLAVSLPPGATFNPGTQQVVNVAFISAVITSAAVTPVNFGDAPTPRQLLDNQLNILSTTYSSGTVSIAAAIDYEGDVYPRPAGDKNAGLTDWLLMGRYVARLDYPTNAAEFQRADCAPRSTLGDGTIRICDWVQSGRFEAGLDPLTPVGGPTNELVLPGPAPSTTRLVVAGSMALGQGQSGTVPVDLVSQGDENAVGFSLSYDPSLVVFEAVVPGNGAAGATLYINTNQANAGRLGFAMALGAGDVFPGGTTELVRISFRALGTGSGSFAPSFVDLPVPRDTSDARAISLPTSYVNGSVSINPPPSLTISRGSTNVVLAWPLWASNYVLQESATATSPVAWTNLPAPASQNSNVWNVVVPLGPTNTFFRLYLH